MKRILVAYFSASGVTERAAKELAQVLGADVYKIEPAVPYTEADLNWMNGKSRSTVEMKDPSSRPELGGEQADISAYDTVYLGYPIWWGVAPHIINSFLESGDFSGKTIVPFATSGGSGIGNTKKYLAPSAPGAVLAEGKRLGGTVDADALKKWTDGLM